MNYIVVALVLLITLFNYSVNSANILGVFTFPSPSHHMLGSTLMKELVRRGHNVTMLSPFPLKEPIANYKDVSLDELIRKGEEMTNSLVTAQKDEDKMPVMIKTFLDILHTTLKHENVQNLLTQDNKFDLILYDTPGTDVFFGLTHTFNAPAILFSPFGDMEMLSAYSGNYYPLSYLIGQAMYDLTTFTGRLKNVMSTIILQIYYKATIVNLLNDIHEQYFPDAPSIIELHKNIALILLNSHYTYETPRPYTPNVIQIGGFNLINHKPIQVDLKNWLDEAEDGVVLISYGSKIKGFAFNSDKINLFLNVFGRLKQKVLWKFDVNELENMTNVVKVPNNIRFETWIQQKEVLNHPNVKVFVTHGGMGGVTEAIYGGVPMVGTPFYGDQERNVRNMVINYGYGIELNFHSLTEDALEGAINEVLLDPKYMNKIKSASMAFKNQPICPLEKAIYWIEHVIKYKGADHLKPASTKLSFFQHYLFDVALFLIGAISLISYISYIVIRKLFCCIFRRK